MGILIERDLMAGVAGFGLAFSTMAVASWILSPGWVVGWLGDRGEQMVYSRAVPTLWGLAHDVFPSHVWLAAGAATAALLIWLTVWLWRNRNGAQLGMVLSFGIVTGLLATPFTWPYDQTLLLLPLVAAMAWVSARRTRAVWWSVLLIWLVAMPYVLYGIAVARDSITGNALVPASLLGILILVGFSPEAERPKERG